MILANLSLPRCKRKILSLSLHAWKSCGSFSPDSLWEQKLRICRISHSLDPTVDDQVIHQFGWKNWEKIAFAPAAVPLWGDERFRRIINDTTRQVVRGVSLAWSNRWMQKRDNGDPEDPGSWGGEEAKGTWMSNYLHPPRQSLEGSLVLVKRGCISFSFPQQSRGGIWWPIYANFVTLYTNSRAKILRYLSI